MLCLTDSVCRYATVTLIHLLPLSHDMFRPHVAIFRCYISCTEAAALLCHFSIQDGRMGPETCREEGGVVESTKQLHMAGQTSTDVWCVYAFILCLRCPVCRQRPCDGLIPHKRSTIVSKK
jgi:hypothetical protein